MEEKSRGLSLRRKRTTRPKISAPKQISAPISAPIPTNGSSLAPPSLAPSSHRPSIATTNSDLSIAPSVRPRADGTTADYVKRRYSTKIPQLPPGALAGFADAPAMPAVPSHFLSTPPARAETRRISTVGPAPITGDIAVDMQALNDPDLKPEQYVSQLLANASEADIRAYQAELVKQKHRNSADLQHNVYQNRSQFIRISQEADKLKAEMRTLRTLMSELTATLGQTNAALGISTDSGSSSSSTTTSSARKFANRSSVANLEAMWSTHLQELWRRVEGSQKFLPAIPGRHVVHESGRWVELNAATWKPKRRVHLILLNDHLLMASEKKRIEASPLPNGDTQRANAPAGQVLAAERCWPLQDIDMSDLGTKAVPTSRPLKGGKPSNAHAVNIRIGMDSFTFAATDAEGNEKAAFLARFRKAAADLKRTMHVDVNGDTVPSAKDRLSRMSRGINPAVLKANGLEQGPSVKATMLVEVDGRQQEFRWMETQVDELDIDIALQRFEEAVKRIDMLRRVAKTNRSNTVVHDLVEGRVQSSAVKLSKAIIRQMTSTNSHMTATQRHTAWLVKLGFEAKASEAYLDSRSEVVKTRVGQCADAGDLHQYLYQISYIYFTLIRNTVAIYQACFAPAMMSAAVKWAKDHVDDFNNLLARQTGRLQRGSDEWNYCMDRAREHAAMLSSVGIDFKGLIGRSIGQA